MNQTDEAAKTLVVLLARERALFAPFRQRHWAAIGCTAGTAELQRDFRRVGLPWAVGGSVTERKNAEQQIADLRRAGLITSGGRTKARRVRLTDRGRAVAQVLCNVPNLSDGHRAVCKLLTFGRAGELISELLPAGLRNYGEASYQAKLSDFQMIVLPAIIAEWVEAASDCHGRAAYRVTPEGEVAAQQPEPTCPPEIANDEMAAFFWAEYDAERERLLSARPSHPNEIGPIPLSAGLWDEVVGPWNYKPARKPRARKVKK